jgi:hypothetical protein
MQQFMKSILLQVVSSFDVQFYWYILPRLLVLRKRGDANEYTY